MQVKRRKTWRGLGRTRVAQSCALLYRGFAIGRASVTQQRFASANPLPNEIRRLAQRDAAATKVAQSCTLPYRRFAIGWPFGVTHRLARSSPPQNTILRYSRLQICATRNRRGARRPGQRVIEYNSALRWGALNRYQ